MSNFSTTASSHYNGHPNSSARDRYAREQIGDNAISKVRWEEKKAHENVNEMERNGSREKDREWNYARGREGKRERDDDRDIERHRPLDYSRDMDRDMYTTNRERDRYADRERERDRERYPDKERERDRHTDMHAHRSRDYEQERYAGRAQEYSNYIDKRHTDAERGRDREREKYMERSHESERDKYMDRTRDRPMDHEREKYREKYSVDMSRQYDRDYRDERMIRHTSRDEDRERDRRERMNQSSKDEDRKRARDRDRDRDSERYKDRRERYSAADVYNPPPIHYSSRSLDGKNYLSNNLMEQARYQNPAFFPPLQHFQAQPPFYPSNLFPNSQPFYSSNAFPNSHQPSSHFMPAYPHPLAAQFYPFVNPSQLTTSLIPPNMPPQLTHGRHYSTSPHRGYSRYEGTVYTSELPYEIKERYKAAGVLPYSFDAKGTMYLLLGCEDRTGKRKYPDRGQDMSRVWLHFGGKKELDELDPALTALREMDEETGGVFHKQMAWISSRIHADNISKLWFPGGKYVLYFLEVPHDTTIAQRFSLIDPSTRESMDQTRLEWIPCSHLAKAVKERGSKFTLPTEGEQQFFGFFMEMMSVQGVVNHILSLKSTLGTT